MTDCQFWNFSAFETFFCCYFFVILLVACLQQLQTLCLVRNSIIPNLGHVSDVMTCSPSFWFKWLCLVRESPLRSWNSSSTKKSRKPFPFKQRRVPKLCREFWRRSCWRCEGSNWNINILLELLFFLVPSLKNLFIYNKILPSTPSVFATSEFGKDLGDSVRMTNFK